MDAIVNLLGTLGLWDWLGQLLRLLLAWLAAFGG